MSKFGVALLLALALGVASASPLWGNPWSNNQQRYNPWAAAPPPPQRIFQRQAYRKPSNPSWQQVSNNFLANPWQGNSPRSSWSQEVETIPALLVFEEHIPALDFQPLPTNSTSPGEVTPTLAPVETTISGAVTTRVQSENSTPAIGTTTPVVETTSSKEDPDCDCLETSTGQQQTSTVAPTSEGKTTPPPPTDVTPETTNVPETTNAPEQTETPGTTGVEYQTTIKAVTLPAKLEKKSEKLRELPTRIESTKEEPEQLGIFPLNPQINDNNIENMVVVVDDGSGNMEVRTLAKFVEELLELRARTKGTNW